MSKAEGSGNHRIESARLEAVADGVRRALVGSVALAAAASYDLATHAKGDEQLTPLMLAAVVPGSITASVGRRIGLAPKTARKIVVAASTLATAAVGVTIAHKYGFKYTAESAGLGAAAGAMAGVMATEAYSYDDPFQRLARRPDETASEAAPAQEASDPDETTASLKGIPPMPPGPNRSRFSRRRSHGPARPPMPLTPPAFPVPPARQPQPLARPYAAPPTHPVPLHMPAQPTPASEPRRRGGMLEAIQISYADIAPQPETIAPTMPQPQHLGPDNAALAQMMAQNAAPQPPVWPPMQPGV